MDIQRCTQLNHDNAEQCKNYAQYKVTSDSGVIEYMCQTHLNYYKGNHLFTSTTKIKRL